MAPQKFASVRYKTGRPIVKVTPFRDDTNTDLIAFRYEQAVQAKPPIPIVPIPPRNPARMNSTSSRPASSIIRPVSSISNISILSAGPGTIIVPPPPLLPDEEHPAFRRHSINPISEEWKRDSGLSAAATTTPSTTTTIHEEDDETNTDVTCPSRAASTRSQKTWNSSHIPFPATAEKVQSGAEAVHQLTADNWNLNKEQPSPHQAQAQTNLSSSIPIVLSASSPSTPSSPLLPSPLLTSSISAPPAETTAPSGIASTSASRAFSFRSTSTGPKRLQKKRSSAGAGSPPVQSRGASPKSTSPKMPEPHFGFVEDGSRAGANSKDAAANPKSTSRDSKDNFITATATATPVIDTDIPTESLVGDDFLTSLTFSKRGSLMFGGKRAFDFAAIATDMESEEKGSSDSAARDTTIATDATTPANTTTATTATDASAKPSQSIPSIRVMPLDIERESQKVRSLYESGEAAPSPAGGLRGLHDTPLEPPTEEEEDAIANAAAPVDESAAGENVASLSSADPQRPRTPAGAAATHPSPSKATPTAATPSPQPSASDLRGKYELAGGIEDWEDINSSDVDRYGFINVRRPTSRASTPDTGQRGDKFLTPPRKRNVLQKRPGSAAGGYASSPLGRRVSARSLNTQASEHSTVSRRSSRSVRAAANLLPHNRDRKLQDEAGDMLSLAPGLADIAEDETADKISDAAKRKEIERAEKWRKMAKVVKKGKEGEGMEFEFDTKNQKLIDRTWKGIPDRWRGAAWFSFLATSARRAGCKTTTEEIIADFHRLQDMASPDDVQIDLDVPRTINRHIMFRKRYRGGQRLLFRVLHALSLYFPDTGYVQGMASLAATLLCYYDEEKTFVMLVRMWQFRGLERLYAPGFEGLMTCLQDFEKYWLGDKDVAKKLTELMIDPTAYGTRWYLTLFNLSVPFPAQLRIWDVFMLLGDCPPTSHKPPPTPKTPNLADDDKRPGTKDSKRSAKDEERIEKKLQQLHGMDVLHATSAAMIHALRDVLLDSDFENAMKALTSFVPVKDEEMLMKVTRTEWKQRHGKKK